MSTVDFARYVHATQKRLVNHFAVSPGRAAGTIRRHERDLAKWHASRVPADRAAMLLYAKHLANPIDARTWWAIGAVLAAGLGVYLIAKGRTAQTTSAPYSSLQPPPSTTYV